jgi:toxin ParE1/3/4
MSGNVSENRGLRFRVAGSARRDIAGILKRSLREFGMDAAVRYRALIRQALRDIENDHEWPGSVERPELMVDGARTYHISLSRDRVASGRVKYPRHFVLYRQRPDGAIDVARILHDSCDLDRHIPEDYRRMSA